MTYDKLTKKIMKDVANDMLHEVQKLLHYNDKIVTGAAVNSFRVVEEGDRIFVRSEDPGAFHINSGRKPNSRLPPREVIEQWLIDRFNMDVDRARSEAIKVAQKIARDGIEPLYVFMDIFSRYDIKRIGVAE